MIGVLMITSVYSQKIYRKAQWGVNETKTSGSQITRIKGENKVVIITNVGYQSQAQLIEDLKEKKKQGKVGGDKYKTQMNEYKNKSQGGMVYLYLERPEPSESNTQNFRVRILDESGNLIQEKQMRTQDGKMNRDGSAYRNDGTVFVKAPLTTSFIVEVIEQTPTGEKVYKFKVNI